MKYQFRILVSLILVLSGIITFDCTAQLPQEQPLWTEGVSNNPVKYKEEKLTANSFRKSSVSQLNRVFSCVSVPTYIIHKPEKGKGNGVAMVICPGGGFRDVWFDREGNDLGLWLAQRGITSLVLKSKNFTAELHIYVKGGHGFDSGLERGYGISTWRDSFIAWLKDTGFIVE